MSSTYYVCCIYSNALQIVFTLEVNKVNTMSMDHDETFPIGAVWSDGVHIACNIGQGQKQMGEQTTFDKIVILFNKHLMPAVVYSVSFVNRYNPTKFEKYS